MAKSIPSEDVSKSSSDPIVKIDDLYKEFRDDADQPVVAVENLDLNIRDGEFLVFVGPSGCGKTTTLRCVAGLETPTDGKIVIDDEDVTGLDPRQRDIAMVFQNYALYPHKTVRENLAFPLQIRKHPKDAIAGRVSETAEILDISDLLDRKPKELSGGQQQRVALGRAIIRDASVFLLDEPLSNLDAKLRIQMRTELNKIHNQIGKTTIYVTHDQAEAMTLGDRIAVLNDGQLQQIGRPKEIYKSPVNRFVAGFIGEPAMNFLPITLVHKDDHWVIESAMFEAPIPERIAEQYPLAEWAEKDLTFGMRPEDIHDDQTNAQLPDDAASFKATAQVVEPLGPDKYLTFTDESQDSGLEFTARLSSESPIPENETIELLLDMDRMHIFDDRTGKNLVL